MIGDGTKEKGRIDSAGISVTDGCEDCLPPENEPNEFERDAASENLDSPQVNVPVHNISAKSESVSCSCNDHCCNSERELGSITLEDSNSDHDKTNHSISGILSDMARTTI